MKVPLNKKNLEFLVSTYKNDILGMGIDLFGFNRYDEWQKWLVETILNPKKKRVAVASCHSSGKTLISCLIALHRILCYPEARVTITSATEAQLKAAFGTTMQTIIERSLIGDWFNASAEQIVLKGVASSWIKLRAWSENRPESFQGVHCESPLFIFDEASGIHPSIFEAVDGSMMHPYSKKLLLGNPLHRHGELFDAFHTKRGMYEVANVSANDSTFISEEWIEEMKEEYGENSALYRVKVLGLFPETELGGFIPETLIRSAFNREVHVSANEPVVAGLDVGRYRDASVLCTRKGPKVLNLEEIRSRDLMVVSELVNKKVLKYGIERVCVDENGIGAGVGDRLRQLQPGKIFPVKLGTYGIDRSKEYFNGRAELWGKAKKWLKYGSLPANETLARQGASLLFSFDTHGRYQLERKKDAEARKVGSPDYFDAFAYSFGIPTPQVLPKNNEQQEVPEIAWY